MVFTLWHFDGTSWARQSTDGERFRPQAIGDAARFPTVRTSQLGDLLGEGGEIEVVAPESDFARVVQLEHPGDWNLSLFAVFHRDRVDARIENDVALMQALQDFDAESARILHEALRHLTDRLFAFCG